MTHHPSYPNLSSPRQVGPLIAKNRVWMTPHTTGLFDHDFSDEQIAYYVERARGGVGAITLQAMPVHPTALPNHRLKMLATDERIIDNYARLYTALREYDVLLMAQLWHRGRQMDGIASRRPVWAPSPIPCSINREMPHEMSEDEIDEVVAGYVEAARNAVAGGVDGVEIHGIAHGYLIGQFLSPATNHRTDAYGGTLTNRMRLLLRVLEGIREAVPSTKVLGMRISNDEGIDGGLGTDDWASIATQIAETGMIDYLSVTQGTYLNKMMMYGVPPGQSGYQFEQTARIKEAVGDVPVIVAGRITTPDMAEHAIEAGVADFVGLTRQLIADASWVSKALGGHPNDIRPCVGANWCYVAVNRATLACAHNPAVGRELQLGAGTLRRHEQGGDVAIVGGGPAGLRAAYTAAKRGFSVHLYEASSHLGGQLNLLRGSPYAEYAGIVDWLIEQNEALGVSVHVDTQIGNFEEFSGTFLQVIVATGSTYLRSGMSAVAPADWSPGNHIVGSDQWNVYDIAQVLSSNPREIPNRVLVFDDTGSRDPLVAAEVLALAGHPVSFVSRHGTVGQDLVETQDQGFVYGRLRRLGVAFHTRMVPTVIDGDRMHLRDLDTQGEVVFDDVDAVVLSTGKQANTALRDAAAEASVPTTWVGDCVAPRRFFNAIWEAEQAARNIPSQRT